MPRKMTAGKKSRIKRFLGISKQSAFENSIYLLVLLL
jgi:hypothetical protein